MKPQQQNKSQRERFEQAARELGVELDEQKLKDALRKIAPDPQKGEPASDPKKD